MPKMTKPQEELPKILEDAVTKYAKKFKRMCRARAKNAVLRKKDFKKRGKKTRNPLLTEKKFTFRLPETYCNTESFKDMDEVMSKLGVWKLQNRVRATKLRDTYYYHSSSTRKFRSIREVVNYILPESYPKLQPRKRTKREDVDETPEGLNENSQDDKDVDETPKDLNENSQDAKKDNLELQNASKGTLQAPPPKVEAFIENGHETGDETMNGVEKRETMNNVVEKDLPLDEAMNGDVAKDCPCDELVNEVERDLPLDEPVNGDVAEDHLRDEMANDIEEYHCPLEEAMSDAAEDCPGDEVVNETTEDRPHDEVVNHITGDPPHEEAMNDVAEGRLGEEAMNGSLDDGAKEDDHQDKDVLEDISLDFGAYDDLLMNYYVD